MGYLITAAVSFVLGGLVVYRWHKKAMQDVVDFHVCTKKIK